MQATDDGGVREVEYLTQQGDIGDREPVFFDEEYRAAKVDGYKAGGEHVRHAADVRSRNHSTWERSRGQLFRQVFESVHAQDNTND